MAHSNTTKPTAKQLLALLRDKHVNDVFVPECKNGPSQSSGGHLRLDAVAMNRSWTNACVIGYEIKVSRSDFLGDKKWPGYLEYCNRFTFVCPSGLIQAEEVGPECGLMWSSKTGGRLYTKKKAPYRRLPPVNFESMFRYILMCRADIRGPLFNGSPQTQEEYWRAWMEKKEQRATFGHRVSKRIQLVIEKDILSVERENRRLVEDHKTYAKVEDAMVELGLCGDWNPTDKLREMVQDRGKTIPKNLSRLIDQTLLNLKAAKNIIDEAGEGK